MQEKENHFIKNIEIKNFKCFEDFKAEGFGRVNLIGGKNNVGKTAFMEAVYVNVHSKDIKEFITSLDNIKFMRNFLNIQESEHNIKDNIEQLNHIFTKSNVNNTFFEIEEIEGVQKYIFEFNGISIKPNSNEFSFTMNHNETVQFIDSLGFSNNQIIKNYSAIQRKDEEEYLNILLKKFDLRIEAFKIIYEKPQCKVDGDYFEVIEFGDGVRHLISIVTSLYKAENGYLLIDELDNGIHYTMLDDLWYAILEVSKRLNVQVFTTTHSKECIESYYRVAKKLDDKDITYIGLNRLKNGNIKAGVYNYALIENSMQQEHEVRGW